jgi:hypothetical protein
MLVRRSDAMTDVIGARRTDLQDLCRRHGVARLALFDSALRDDFDPDTSDLDLAVEFSSMSPSDHAGAYFVTTGDVSQRPQYGYTASAKDEPIGPQFLRIADINKQAWIDWMSVPYCQISSADYEKYKVQTGDILIARMADPGHGDLIRFRPKDAENARFIQYWLRSDAYWQLVKSRSAGTTRANLNAKVLSGFPLILPNRAVASAFQEVADSLRSEVVAYVEQSKTLSFIRDALLLLLISGELRAPDAGRIVEETVSDQVPR